MLRITPSRDPPIVRRIFILGTNKEIKKTINTTKVLQNIYLNISQQDIYYSLV